MNMMIMFKRGILTGDDAFCIYSTQLLCFTYQPFCFSPLTCYITTQRKQWSLPGPSIRVRAQLDQSQMWLSRCWLCLSCLRTRLRTDSSFSGLFFPPSLPRIYIHRVSFWHKLQTKSILVLSYKRLCLLENVTQGPWFMASVQWRWCLWESAHFACLLGRKSTAEICVSGS